MCLRSGDPVSGAHGVVAALGRQRPDEFVVFDTVFLEQGDQGSERGFETVAIVTVGLLPLAGSNHYSAAMNSSTAEEIELAISLMRPMKRLLVMHNGSKNVICSQ